MSILPKEELLKVRQQQKARQQLLRRVLGVPSAGKRVLPAAAAPREEAAQSAPPSTETPSRPCLREFEMATKPENCPGLPPQQRVYFLALERDEAAKSLGQLSRQLHEVMVRKCHLLSLKVNAAEAERDLALARVEGGGM